jgi:hypothetical protein
MPKSGRSFVQIQIRIPTGLDDAVERYCAENGINKTNAVRVALHNLVDGYEQRPASMNERSQLVETVTAFESAMASTDQAMKKIADLAKLLRGKQ